MSRLPCRRTLRPVRIVVVSLLLAAAGLAWLWFRPNRAEVDPRLALEHWDAVADGMHNSNTDMIVWQGDFLLVHDARPYHFGSPDARLVLRRSKDGRSWQELARFSVPGKDIRDPKLAVIGGRLHLYALPNSGVAAKTGSCSGVGGVLDLRKRIGGSCVARCSLETVNVSVGEVTEVDRDTFWPVVKAAGDKLVVLDMYTQWCVPDHFFLLLVRISLHL